MTDEKELAETGICAWVPRDAIRIDIIATMLGDDDAIYKVQKTMSLHELAEAHQIWADNFETYRITEKGMELFEGVADAKED